jgi:hypothetical protein
LELRKVFFVALVVILFLISKVNFLPKFGLKSETVFQKICKKSRQKGMPVAWVFSTQIVSNNLRFKNVLFSTSLFIH